MKMKPHILSAMTSTPERATDANESVLSRSIGDLIQSARQLSDEQIESIVAYQRQHRVRFGEAAQALRLASADDVLWALSQQFHYPYPHSASAGTSDAELVVAANPFSSEAETFRELRSQLLMGVLGPTEPRRALAVISPDIGDGKTYVAANVAVALSQLGERTLLVDADMRTPRMYALFDLPQDVYDSGLSGLLAGRAGKVIRAVPDLPSLYLLPSGAIPPNPLELVQRAAFSLLLQELLAKFDHVVVDTPANQHGADARVIASRCGAALVIGRKHRSRMDAMHALVQSLAGTTVKLAGVVLNDR
jgi:protein-tyrosine kinase